MQNNKGADQPTHRASVIHGLDSTISKLFMGQKRLYLVYKHVGEQAGLNIIWSQIPKTGFLATRPVY